MSDIGILKHSLKTVYYILLVSGCLIRHFQWKPFPLSSMEII